ncbi:MAG: hypothetical protein ACI4K5_06560 [Ruminococcus sp.]
MAYADFPYYRDFFKGTLIKDENAFRTLAERSSEFIDTVTFDRLSDEELLNQYKNKIQKCTCALSEMLFKRNLISDSDSENMPKTSETIGAYSVEFANPYDYVKEISMSDSDFRKALKNTALRYLGNTGLMFRGVI